MHIKEETGWITRPLHEVSDWIDMVIDRDPFIINGGYACEDRQPGEVLDVFFRTTSLCLAGSHLVFVVSHSLF